MEKTKFNLETLIKMPVGNPIFYLYADGCGCAFGIGYAASHEVDWTSDSGEESKPKLAVSNKDAMNWKYSLENQDPVLFRIFTKAEVDMLCAAKAGKVPENTVVKIKKKLIEDLAKHGYVDVPEDADIGALVRS